MVCFQPQKPAQTLSLNPRAGTTRTLSWLKIITTNILWVVQISLTASCILSDYAHAAGAYYEIIIACTAGAVTFLIENSRSLPYIPPERSQGRMTLQSCQCKTEREPVAQTTFQSWRKQSLEMSPFPAFTPSVTHLPSSYRSENEISWPITRADSSKHSAPASLWCLFKIATVAHIPLFQRKSAAWKT